MPSAFVYAAVRTPFGRYGGALSDVRPDDLEGTLWLSVSYTVRTTNSRFNFVYPFYLVAGQG